MLKIIFLSPVHPLLTPGDPLPWWQMQSSWVRGLEKTGAEVRVVKYTPEDGRKLNRFERILQNIRVIRVIRPAFVSTQGRNFGEAREIGKVDLIIYSLGANVLLPSTLRLIKWFTGAPLVILSGVSPVSDGNPREREMAKFVDLAAVNDEKQAREWRELGVKKAVVLPISAMDPELHFNKGRAFRLAKGPALKDRGIRDIDVLFVGTLTPERKEFFGSLRKLLPETVNFVIKEFIWEEEYARVMSRAKIILNPIRSEMKTGANLRMFEIPAFGALELASFGKKEWLAPGKEMLVYKDVKEAAGLIVKYLKEEKIRKEMAQRGKRRVLAEHKFEDRAERLFEMIRNKRINE